MGAATISRPMWQGPRSRAGAGSLPNCFTAFSMLSLQRWKPTRSPRQAVQVRFDGGIRIPLPCSTTKPLASVKDSSIPHQRRTVSRILRTICSSPSTLSRCANGPAISPYPNCCCTALAQASATSAIGRVPSMDTTLARVPTSRLYSRSICCICCGVSYRSSLAPRCFTRSSAMEAGTYKNSVKSALRAYRFAAWMKSCETVAPWYASELRLYRSRMTSSPRARRGSICAARWSRRSAAKSNPTGPSLGWWARWTVRPRPRNFSARSCAWVVVPAPSRPSKTMKRPGCALTASPPATDRSPARPGPGAAGAAPRFPAAAGPGRGDTSGPNPTAARRPAPPADRRTGAASRNPGPAWRTRPSRRPRRTLPPRRARIRRPTGACGQRRAAASSRPRARRCRAGGPSAALYGVRTLTKSIGRLEGSGDKGSDAAERQRYAALGAARAGRDAGEASRAEDGVGFRRLRVGRRHRLREVTRAVPPARVADRGSGGSPAPGASTRIDGRRGARTGILVTAALHLQRPRRPVRGRAVRLVRRPFDREPLLGRSQRGRRQRGLLQVGDAIHGRLGGSVQGLLQPVERRSETGDLGGPAQDPAAARALHGGLRI